MEDDQKRQLVTQFFHAAAPLLQNAQVVPKPNDDEIQLRGIYSGYPMRVVCDAFFDLAFDVKAEGGPRNGLCFRFDPDSAPSPGDVDPWDEDDEVRVFLARCIFVEDSAGDIDATLRRIGALPVEFLAHLYQLMHHNDLTVVNLTSQGPGASFRHHIGTMWDPMTQLQQVLWLLAYGANVYRALPVEQAYTPQAYAAPQAAAPFRAQCRYCSTIYLLDATSQCPNCGAPYTG